MTFEEWYYSDAIRCCPDSYEQAYTAGQESMRPLVEKMREALKTYAPIGNEYDWGDGLSQKAIAESDKFLGER